MNFSLSVRYTIREKDNIKVLCFKHAVQAIIENDVDVDVEVDEFGMSDYDFRNTICDKCS